MANEFKVKNGLIVIGDLTTSGTITINGALAATQSWVTSQAYLTSASLSGYATQSYVTSALAALVDAAPAALDTLNELAAALGDDASFSTTITNSIASKLSLTGGTLTGALNGTSASFSSNVTLGNNADLVFVDLAGTFPTSGKGFDWTLNNDGARIYAIQPNSDSIDFVFQLRDNATTNDRFVFWVDEWQGPAYDKYPLIISGGTEFDLKDSSLYTNTVLRLSNSGVLQNVTGNISMFTNNAGYLTSYTETDTLATVTGRGATTSTNISVNTVILGTDATYGGAYRSVSFGYNGDSYNRILAANNTSDGMYFMAATGQGFNFRPNGGTANLVVINSSGSAGIGTTSPQKKLDVFGGAGILASFGSSLGIGQFAGLHFGYSESNLNNDNYKKSALVFERTDNNNHGSNASGKIHFLLNNSLGTSANALTDSVVTIDSDANGTVGSVRMGIGTRNPSYPLEVNGNLASLNSSAAGLFSISGTRSIAIQSFAGDWNYIRSNNANLVFGTQDAANLYIRTNDTDRIFVNTAGKVAIGTTDTNSDKSDFTVYTGGTTTLALAGDLLRVGDSDVNWGVALRSNGFLETYAQPLYLRTITGSQPVVIGPNGTNTVEFHPDYTLFNGLNLAISRTNSTHGASNYFRGDTSHLVIGTGGTLYLNYGGGTTIITGNTTVSGLLGVTGIVSANARKLSLGILDLNSGITPTQYKIKTNIPWNYGGSDFTVNIKGFRYGVGQMVSLSIGWHFYNNEFYSRNAICNGAWAPTISLAKSPDGYVIIYIPGPEYWPKLYIESVYSSNSADSYTSGWSWTDADLSDCTLIQTVPYKDLATNISGNAATATSATTAGALSNMNISQFTNNSGYITGYTETDTLASVTGRGATTSTAVTFNGGVNLAADTGIRKSGDNWIIGYSTSLPGIAIGSGTATDKVSISAGGTQKVWFDTNGRVGIGTSTPAEELHVIGRGIFNGGSGNSSTDAVVYITKSTNDDWGLYVNNAGLDYGMYARVSPSANYALAIHNGTTWTTRITGNAIVYLGEKNAIEGNYDSWLRLNNSNHYASGVYTPGVMRADGGFYVSGSTVLHAGNYNSYTPTLGGTGASGTWSISVTGSAGSATTSSSTYRGIIEDTRAAQRTPNDYDDYRASWEFTNQIPGLSGSTWWSLMTLQGWHNAYAAWQIIGPSDDGPENWYLRVGNNTTWGTARRIWHSGDFTSSNISNWNTAYGWGNHASAGYLTSYSETDTLASVTGRGTTTSANISVNNVKIGTDGTYSGSYSTIGFGGTTNGYNRVFGQSGTSDGLFLASATGRGIYFRPNGGDIDRVTINAGGNVAINTSNFTYANGDNVSVISGVVPTANKLFIDGSIQLLNNTDAIVIGRGASTFLTDEELGFGWGGGWYMIDASYLRVRNNISVYSTGSFYGSIFYDVNDTNYYIDPNSTSNINNLSVVGYQSIGGQTSNGQSNYQWDGATYRNPDQWTARLILRRDNATTGINGSIPSLVIFNNNGADQTTASMVFATNECVTGSNSVNLAGIIAKKESVGNCGGWSSGSLNFFVKNFGARVDSLALTPDGNATFSGIVYSTGYGNSSQWNTAYGWGNHASYSYATTSYVTTQINNLINGAPGVLDTLDELAAALGDDANFATTVTNSIATKLPLAGGTMSGTISFINNLGTALQGTIGDNDFWRIHANSTSSNAGYLEIATSDDGTEPIYVRQYTGVFSSLTRTATLLDGSGNTSFPGIVYASSGDSTQWNTAYGWGNHASAGYALDSSLANYLPLSGGVIGGGVTINGNLTVNGTITENSSLKLKENVETSEGNLEKVVNLRPVTYNKIGSQTTELGLIAEEVAEVYPEFVQYDENGEPIGVHYSRLTAALIGAVKELNEQLQELKRNK